MPKIFVSSDAPAFQQDVSGYDVEAGAKTGELVDSKVYDVRDTFSSYDNVGKNKISNTVDPRGRLWYFQAFCVWIILVPCTITPMWLSPLASVFSLRSSVLLFILIYCESLWCGKIAIMTWDLCKNFSSSLLKTHLICTVSTIMSLYSLALNEKPSIWGFCTFARTIVLGKPFRHVQQCFKKQFTASLLRPLNGVVIILYLNHLLCCLFLYVVETQDKNDRSTWNIYSMSELKGTNFTARPSWDEKYLKALYFTTQTIFTVGYGDCSPVTIAEKQIASVYTVIGSIIFGFIIACISSTVKHYNISSSQARYRRDVLRKYMKRRNMPLKISDYALASFDVYGYELGGKFPSKILHEMPRCLQIELARLDSDMLRKLSLFREAEEVVVRHLAEQMTSHLYLPSETLATSTSLQQRPKIEIIRKGKACIFSTDGIMNGNENKCIKQKLYAGDAFGEFETLQKLVMEGIVDVPHKIGFRSTESYTYRSKTVLDTARLTISSIIKVITFHDKVQSKKKSNRRKSLVVDEVSISALHDKGCGGTGKPIISISEDRRSSGFLVPMNESTNRSATERDSKKRPFLLPVCDIALFLYAASLWSTATTPLRISAMYGCDMDFFAERAYYFGAMDVFCDLVFLADAILHVKETISVKSRAGVNSKSLMLKIILFFPFHWFFFSTNQHLSWFGITRLVSVHHIFTGLSKLKLALEDRGMHVGSDVFLHVRCLLVTAFFVHLTSCAFMTGFVTSECTSYLVGVYWTLTTMTSTGFGDIVPKTKPGMLLTIMAIYVGTFLYAFVVASITALFHESGVHDGDPRYRRDICRQYMIDLKINTATERRALSYIKFYAGKFGNIVEQSLLNHELPAKLSKKLTSAIKSKFLQLGFSHLESEIQQKIMERMAQQFYFPGDTMRSPFPGAYFVNQGSVEIKDFSKNLTAKLAGGTSFGVSDIFQVQESDISVSFLEPTEVYYLSKHDFYSSIEDDPEVDKILHTGKDQAMAVQSNTFQATKRVASGNEGTKTSDNSRLLGTVNYLQTSVAWDAVLVCVFIWNFITLPFRASFMNFYDMPAIIYMVDYFGDLAFLFDLFCQLQKSGVKWNQIAQVGTSVKVNIVASIPFEVFAANLAYVTYGFVPAFALCRLNKLLRCHVLIHHASRVGKLLVRWNCKISDNMATVLKLIIVMIGSAHIISCVWFFLATSTTNETNWAEQDDGELFANCTAPSNKIPLQLQNGLRWYLRSLYFTIATLTTVGFGDITPSNGIERAFTICLFIIGTFIFTFIIGSLEKIIAQIDVTSTIYNRKVEMLKTYFKTRPKLSNKIQTLCLSYLDHLWNVRKGAKSEEVFNILPGNLKTDINYVQVKTMLSRLSVVKILSIDVHKNIASKMKQDILLPDQILYESGEIADTLYFLTNGEIQLLSKSRDMTYTTVTAPSIIEEGDFLLELRRSCTAKSTQISVLLYLTHDQFEEAIFADNKTRPEGHSLRDAVAQHKHDIKGKSLVRKLLLNMKSSKMLKMQAVEKSARVLNNENVWNLDSNRRKVWESILLCTILCEAIVTPARIALGQESEYNLVLFVLFGFILDVVYAADVYFRATKMTILLSDGTVLKRKQEIKKHYMSSTECKTNILTAVPVDMMVFISFPLASPVALAVCRLPRIIRLKDVPRAFDQSVALAESVGCVVSNSSVRFIKMLCMILLASHFSACIFLILSWAGGWEGGIKPWTFTNSVEGHKVLETSDGAQYSISLYWSLYTVTSIGYGDISPKTSVETCWAIIMMMAAAFFCDAGITAILSHGVDTMDSKAALCNERISTAMKFVALRGASKKFLGRTKKCYTEFYINNFGIDEKVVFNSLSFASSNAILRDAILPSIRRHKRLQAMLKDDYGLVISIVNSMTPKTYYSKERLRAPYEEWPGLLYILNGSVVCVQLSGCTYRIPCGTLLGEACFHGKRNTQHNGNEIIATSFCETYTLSSERYSTLLNEASRTATNESNLNMSETCD